MRPWNSEQRSATFFSGLTVLDVDLLAIDRGTVTAPAGCGKTHLIAQALTRHSETKPVLVLTHTNAGVAALRARLDKAGVAPGRYRLSTIDGWCMRLLTLFPKRGGHDPAILSIGNPKAHYPAIRQAAGVLLRDGHINDVLAATYDRLIVDEYQDCSQVQHAIIYYAAQSLRTCVLGDPMQAIFGFQGNTLADWDQHVCAHFPVAAELTKPWRWINAGEEGFGRYLLDVRRALVAGQSVDLAAAPPNISWVHLDGTEDHQRRLRAGAVATADGEKVLIIADSKSPNGQRQFASQIHGAVTVENVDMRDLVTFGENIDLSSPELLDHVVTFATTVMTNTGGANLLNRVATLRAGRERRPASPVEAEAMRLVEKPSYAAAADLLVEIGKEHGVRTHRPAILRGALRLLKSCGDDADMSPANAAVQERERSRLIGRPLAKRTVGSTLLLKGLEADAAVILDPSDMDRRHLYVAMTRGAKRLIICSRNARLTPA
ncbi:DNA helicase UvrD [Sphingorhabdus lacus]|uniref:DNA 3'-5' helicase II n=1 Tax=Sphingorhabdus lacus TaxID=392610 RepID=A0A6I6L757_9SPHN|nr:DNA helicase UvrD [Sphingorhabdus lacus]